MIIECPACRTRFRLDETKIKGRGARVRCRRCGEAIVVLKPEGQSPAPPAETPDRTLDLAAAIRESTEKSWQAPRPHPAAPAGEPQPGLPTEVAPAAEASAEATHPVPEVPAAHELPPTEPAAPPLAGMERSPDLPKDEVDRAFDMLLAGPSEERATRPEEEPVAEPSAEAAPIPGGAPTPEIAQPVSVEGVAPGPEPAPGTAEMPEPPGLAVAFAPEERIAFAPEEHGPARAEEPEAPPFEIVRGIDEQVREGGAPPQGAEAPAPELPAYRLVDEGFLREEKRGAYDITAALQAKPEAGYDEEIPLSASDEQRAEEKTRAEGFQEELMTMEAAASRSAEGKTSDELAEPVTPARPHAPFPGGRIAGVPPKPASGRPLVGSLIALFLVLAAGGAWLGFTEGGQQTLRGFLTQTESWMPGKRRAAPAYNVSNVIGYYEPGARAGKLFVIKGQVTNVSRGRKHGIQIVATLLDARGQAVAEKTVYAGNALAGDFLRQASREKIEGELSNPIGRNLQNIDIPPGKMMPFTTVFFNAPEGIDAYRLEAKDGV